MLRPDGRRKRGRRSDIDSQWLGPAATREHAAGPLKPNGLSATGGAVNVTTNDPRFGDGTAELDAEVGNCALIHTFDFPGLQLCGGMMRVTFLPLDGGVTVQAITTCTEPCLGNGSALPSSKFGLCRGVVSTGWSTFAKPEVTAGKVPRFS